MAYRKSGSRTRCNSRFSSGTRSELLGGPRGLCHVYTRFDNLLQVVYTGPMGLAKIARLNRIFSHPDGRILSLAVDHWAGREHPQGLKNVPAILEQLAPANPDAVTMNKGMARGLWAPYAGRIPLIVQSHFFPPEDAELKRTTQPEEALLLGADAVAVSLGVRGKTEDQHLAMLAAMVTDAAPWDIPVVAHIYPRNFYSDDAEVMVDHEHIQWAVRCGAECGADVIKVPFTGDPDGFREIVEACPVPVVCAGGPKTKTFDESVEMMRKIVASGARGGVVGRNIWGAEDPLAALRAFQEIVHPLLKGHDRTSTS